MVDYAVFGRAIFQILDAYKAQAPLESVPIDINVLKEVIRAKCELTTVAWQAVDVDTPHLLGNVKFYYPNNDPMAHSDDPTTAVISFKSNLAFDLRKLVICKEMCHCFIDSPEDRVRNIGELMTLTEGLASQFSAVSEDGALATEKLAEYVALELLFPIEFRLIHAEAFKAGDITVDQLSERYDLPREYVEFAMYDFYLEFSQGIRQGQLHNVSTKPE